MVTIIKSKIYYAIKFCSIQFLIFCIDSMLSMYKSQIALLTIIITKKIFYILSTFCLININFNKNYIYLWHLSIEKDNIKDGFLNKIIIIKCMIGM